MKHAQNQLVAASPDAETPFFLRTVAIIGAGRAGRECALQCAAAGFDVVVEDVMPANLRRAEELYAELASGAARGQAGAGRLTVASAVEDAVREADLAIDFVPDELESKLEIFSMIDRMAPPKTALLTPSDALSITDLASCTYRGDRCFAVRGGLDSCVVRLMHPKGPFHPIGQAIVEFLTRLGRQVSIEEDTDAPMLVKNL